MTGAQYQHYRMTHVQHKKEKEDTIVKKLIAELVKYSFIVFMTFFFTSLSRSWKMTDIENKMNKQDVINATISTSLEDIKDDLKEIKNKLDKR